MKSSLPKIFAIEFHRYLAWLKRQDLPEIRRRSLASRANHYLAYLYLSTTDFKAALSNSSVRARAWRVYRRFLRESMCYDETMLIVASEELDAFYSFIAAGRPVPAKMGEPVVVELRQSNTAGRLSARPGGRARSRK